MTPWLHIIGIGEDGWEGLSRDARGALERADVIIGGDRHHGLAPDLDAKRIRWPSPFRTMVNEIGALRDQHQAVAILVTGDPLWFSAGGLMSRKFPAEEVRYYPQLSAFQWAAARMRWSLADVETLTVHGRPPEQAIPYFADGARLLVLTQDGTSPATLARLLTDRGFGPSRLTVLAALGGPREERQDGTAAAWGDKPAPDFHLLAVDCISDTAGPAPLPLTGLPDDAFRHDGKITKREVRALTVAALAPRRGAVLWDIGAGSGSVGIEFMRAGRDAEAHAIEPDPQRRAMIAENARTLGVPRLHVVPGHAPEALDGLPRPDSVFIGGGLTPETAAAALAALAPRGRLVANAVTVESEALLTALAAEHGGTLSRLAVSRVAPVGSLHGWKPMMPVTQWVLAK